MTKSSLVLEGSKSLAGEHAGESIIEMANLMYQNNTKTNFFKGVFSALSKREEIVNKDAIGKEEKT